MLDSDSPKTPVEQCEKKETCYLVDTDNTPAGLPTEI